MTPEQSLKAKLKRELSKLLPKGKFLFQPIETTTANGVPDVYFSCQLGKNKFNCWLETKTQDYKVSTDQINWAHAHSLSGGKTWVVTEIDKEIAILDYDDRMSDCSTLGVYIRRYKPTIETIETLFLKK